MRIYFKTPGFAMSSGNNKKSSKAKKIDNVTVMPRLAQSNGKTSAVNSRSSDSLKLPKLLPTSPQKVETLAADKCNTIPQHSSSTISEWPQLPVAPSSEIEQGCGDKNLITINSSQSIQLLTNTSENSTDAALASTHSAPISASITASTPSIETIQIDPNLINGKVKLIYEMYNEEFDIVEGSTTAAAIDDVYCLSFVMPDCKIHLSTLPPAQKRLQDIEGTVMYVEENPVGVYRNLRTDTNYFVYADQNSDRLFQDQLNTKLRLALSSDDGPLPKDDGRAMESCSCLYGNPCVDEYGCRDWSNRYAVAKNNGWKGF